MKKSIYCLLLVFLMIISGCNFESFVSGAGSIFEEGKDHVVDFVGDAKDEFDKWWETAPGDLEKWWDGAADDMEDFLIDAAAKGEEFGAIVSDKFIEISEYLINTKNEVVDNVITSLAEAIHHNAYKSIGSELPVSDKTLIRHDMLNLQKDDLNYDEESFVYKLVMTTLPSNFDSFPASLFTSDGQIIMGIGYTDYKTLYMSDEGDKYYCCGFISAQDEEFFPQDEINQKSLIRRYDHEVLDDTNFVFSYTPKPYKSHCVALGKYIIYGINENFQIEYSCENYSSDNIDHTLGELYSFDENKTISDKEKNSYFCDSDFMKDVRHASRTVDEIKADIYKEIDGLKIDFKNLKLKDIFNVVKEKVSNLFRENGLISDISNLSLNDIFDTDIFSSVPPSNSDEFEKWVVGISTVLVCALSIVVSIFIPQLRSVVGALSGAAVEIFCQVIIDNKGVKGIDYRKVLIACVAGAIASSFGIIADSIVGGITESVFALIDGKSFSDAFEAFFYGVLTGIALGYAFELAGRIIKAGVDLVAPNLINKASNFVGTHQVFFGNKSTKKVTDLELVNAGYSAKRKSWTADDLKSNYSDQLVVIRKGQLPSINNNKFRYLDELGNESTKKVTNGMLGFTDNIPVSMRKPLDGSSEIINGLPIKNGVVDFGPYKPETVKIEGFSLSRNKNFKAADTSLAEKWSINPDVIPEYYKDCLKKMGKTDADLENLIPNDIQNLRKEFSFTWHEIDAKGTIQLIPSNLHGIIGHAGGISELKLSQLYFARNVSLKGYITIYSKIINRPREMAYEL